jgi:hypothetical protein
MADFLLRVADQHTARSRLAVICLTEPSEGSVRPYSLKRDFRLAVAFCAYDVLNDPSIRVIPQSQRDIHGRPRTLSRPAG